MFSTTCWGLTLMNKVGCGCGVFPLSSCWLIFEIYMNSRDVVAL